MASRSQLKRQAEAAVDRWNRLYPTGTQVAIPWNGEVHIHKTTGQAFLSLLEDAHHMPCVPLADIPVPLPLKALRVVSSKPFDPSIVITESEVA